MATINIINLTLAQYTQLEHREEYEFAFNHSPNFKAAVDHIGIGSFMDDKCTAGMVKDLQQEYSSELLVEKLALFSGKTQEEIYSMRLLEFMQSKNWLEHELEVVNKLELEYFGHTSTDLELRAGIEKLGKWGVLLQFKQLANGDITKYYAIREYPYNLFFAWRGMLTDEADFMERYQELRSKQKHN